jgi:hypothetical protein
MFMNSLVLVWRTCLQNVLLMISGIRYGNQNFMSG